MTKLSFFILLLSFLALAETIPEDWEFIGCVPTPSECRYSCYSTSKYAWRAHDPKCIGVAPPYDVACFCPPEIDEPWVHLP